MCGPFLRECWYRVIWSLVQESHLERIWDLRRNCRCHHQMHMDLRSSKWPARIKIYFPSVKGTESEWEGGRKSTHNKESALNTSPIYNSISQVKTFLLFYLFFTTLTLEQSDTAARTLRSKSRSVRWGREKQLAFPLLSYKQQLACRKSKLEEERSLNFKSRLQLWLLYWTARHIKYIETSQNSRTSVFYYLKVTQKIVRHTWHKFRGKQILGYWRERTLRVHIKNFVCFRRKAIYSYMHAHICTHTRYKIHIKLHYGVNSSNFTE